MYKVDSNAKEALEKMKLEISQEVASKIYNGGAIGGQMTQRLVAMGKKNLLENAIKKKEDE